jgi:signal transduction histidine kinase
MDSRGEPAGVVGPRSAALDTAVIHRERMAGLGELTAGIAHELNNPIGYISSNLNTLRRYLDIVTRLMDEAARFMDPVRAAEWHQMLAESRWQAIRGDLAAVVDETREGSEHLKSVVGDLKELARTSIATEQGSIDPCVKAALTVLTHQLKHHCTVERDLHCTEVMLMVRPQLIQLIINLVHNAVQAIARGGRIRVATHQCDGLTFLTVEDDGPGVPAAMQQKIFSPFFTSKPNGNGLGLAIVERIARNHGGSVRYDASPGLGGARFTVELRQWQGTGDAAP